VQSDKLKRILNLKGNGTPIKPATNRHSSESYMTSKIEVTFTLVLTLPEGFGNSFFAKPTNELCRDGQGIYIGLK
jgi:hypothetical protein